MSTRRENPQAPATKRRDADPVRVHADGRLAYWTGGTPGVGRRTFERHPTLEAAEARATELRTMLARRNGKVPHGDEPLHVMMQDGLDALRRQHAPEGTVRQYKSNWNRWVAEMIGEQICNEAELHHWVKVFDALTEERASKATVRSVARTLNWALAWGREHGYLSAEAFGTEDERAGVTKRATKRAPKPERDSAIGPDQCPTVDEVDKYALAAEALYPGHGAALVRLAYATGLRLTEVLALRWDAFDLLTGEVFVGTQLDRYDVWPAVRLPKGGKTRTAFLWTAYRDIAADLVLKSLERNESDPTYGWLFPPIEGITRWADYAGKLLGEARQDCGWHWNFHWLRHAYASTCLTPASFGGYGLPLASVSAWLGHAKPSTTSDMYLQRPARDAVTALDITARRPGA